MFLECVTHPPELFYNDPKSHSFDVVVALRNQNNNRTESSGWKAIEVQIMYERGELVDNQSILEFIDNPGRVKVEESTAFRFRINQVSRNHLNRRFKLRFRLQGDETVFVETTSVMVFSKEASKRSRGKKNKPVDQGPPTKRARAGDVKKGNDQWITKACDVFKGIAWQRTGYEFYTDASGEEHPDKSAPIFKCVCCGAMAGKLQVQNAKAGLHQPNCTLNMLLASRNHECDPPISKAPISKAPISKAGNQKLDYLFTAPDANSMAADLQDILQIPAESFDWLQQDLAEEEELLAQYSGDEIGRNNLVATPLTR